MSSGGSVPVSTEQISQGRRESSLERLIMDMGTEKATPTHDGRGQTYPTINNHPESHGALLKVHMEKEDYWGGHREQNL